MTHYQKWTLERGEESIEIEVKYKFSEGSPTTYSPLYGAESGDPSEVELRDAYSIHDERIKSLDQLTPEEQEQIEMHIVENPPKPYEPEYN